MSHVTGNRNGLRALIRPFRWANACQQIVLPARVEISLSDLTPRTIRVHVCICEGVLSKAS